MDKPLGTREWGGGNRYVKLRGTVARRSPQCVGETLVTVAGGGGLGTEWKEKRWSSWSEVISLGLSGPCFNL